MDLDFCELPTCPHCGHEEEHYWEFFTDSEPHDGDEIEYECSRCEGTVNVQVHIYYRFTTRK